MSVLYDAIMREVAAHIVVTIDVEQPIELLDFVSMFSSTASQFQRFIKANYPALEGDAKIFIREVRGGSIEADLIPMALLMINQMDLVLIVDQFVTRYGALLSNYFQKGGEPSALLKAISEILCKALPQSRMILMVKEELKQFHMRLAKRVNLAKKRLQHQFNLTQKKHGLPQKKLRRIAENSNIVKKLIIQMSL